MSLFFENLRPLSGAFRLKSTSTYYSNKTKNLAIDRAKFISINRQLYQSKAFFELLHAGY